MWAGLSCVFSSQGLGCLNNRSVRIASNYPREPAPCPQADCWHYIQAHISQFDWYFVEYLTRFRASIELVCGCRDNEQDSAYLNQEAIHSPQCRATSCGRAVAWWSMLSVFAKDVSWYITLLTCSARTSDVSHIQISVVFIERVLSNDKHY